MRELHTLYNGHCVPDWTRGRHLLRGPLSRAASYRWVGSATQRLARCDPVRRYIVDLTLELTMCPQLRRDSCLDYLDGDVALLVRFDNTRRRGDPIKKYMSRSFPALHYEIHSRAWTAILVEPTPNGWRPQLLSQGEAEDAQCASRCIDNATRTSI